MTILRLRAVSHRRGHNVEPSHEQPRDLVALPSELGNMNLPAVLTAGMANDHDRQASVGAVVELGQNHRFCQIHTENRSGGR
jgi:hypothetical protein